MLDGCPPTLASSVAPVATAAAAPPVPLVVPPGPAGRARRTGGSAGERKVRRRASAAGKHDAHAPLHRAQGHTSTSSTVDAVAGLGTGTGPALSGGQNSTASTAAAVYAAAATHQQTKPKKLRPRSSSTASASAARRVKKKCAAATAGASDADAAAVAAGRDECVCVLAPSGGLPRDVLHDARDGVWCGTHAEAVWEGVSVCLKQHRSGGGWRVVTAAAGRVLAETDDGLQWRHVHEVPVVTTRPGGHVAAPYDGVVHIATHAAGARPAVLLKCRDAHANQHVTNISHTLPYTFLSDDTRGGVFVGGEGRPHPQPRHRSGAAPTTTTTTTAAYEGYYSFDLRTLPELWERVVVYVPKVRGGRGPRLYGGGGVPHTTAAALPPGPSHRQLPPPAAYAVSDSSPSSEASSPLVVPAGAAGDAGAVRTTTRPVAAWRGSDATTAALSSAALVQLPEDMHTHEAVGWGEDVDLYGYSGGGGSQTVARAAEEYATAVASPPQVLLETPHRDSVLSAAVVAPPSSPGAAAASAEESGTADGGVDVIVIERSNINGCVLRMCREDDPTVRAFRADGAGWVPSPPETKEQKRSQKLMDETRRASASASSDEPSSASASPSTLPPTSSNASCGVHDTNGAARAGDATATEDAATWTAAHKRVPSGDTGTRRGGHGPHHAAVAPPPFVPEVLTHRRVSTSTAADCVLERLRERDLFLHLPQLPWASGYYRYAPAEDAWYVAPHTAGVAAAGFSSTSGASALNALPAAMVVADPNACAFGAWWVRDRGCDGGVRSCNTARGTPLFDADFGAEAGFAVASRTVRIYRAALMHRRALAAFAAQLMDTVRASRRTAQYDVAKFLVKSELEGRVPAGDVEAWVRRDVKRSASLTSSAKTATKGVSALSVPTRLWLGERYLARSVARLRLHHSHHAGTAGTSGSFEFESAFSRQIARCKEGFAAVLAEPSAWGSAGMSMQHTHTLTHDGSGVSATSRPTTPTAPIEVEDIGLDFWGGAWGSTGGAKATTSFDFGDEDVDLLVGSSDDGGGHVGSPQRRASAAHRSPRTKPPRGPSTPAAHGDANTDVGEGPNTGTPWPASPTTPAAAAAPSVLDGALFADVLIAAVRRAPPGAPVAYAHALCHIWAEMYAQGVARRGGSKAARANNTATTTAAPALYAVCSWREIAESGVFGEDGVGGASAGAPTSHPGAKKSRAPSERVRHQLVAAGLRAPPPPGVNEVIGWAVPVVARATSTRPHALPEGAVEIIFRGGVAGAVSLRDPRTSTDPSACGARADADAVVIPPFTLFKVLHTVRGGGGGSSGNDTIPRVTTIWLEECGGNLIHDVAAGACYPTAAAGAASASVKPPRGGSSASVGTAADFVPFFAREDDAGSAGGRTGGVVHPAPFVNGTGSGTTKDDLMAYCDALVDKHGAHGGKAAAVAAAAAPATAAAAHNIVYSRVYSPSIAAAAAAAAAARRPPTGASGHKHNGSGGGGGSGAQLRLPSVFKEMLTHTNIVLSPGGCLLVDRIEQAIAARDLAVHSLGRVGPGVLDGKDTTTTTTTAAAANGLNASNAETESVATATDAASIAASTRPPPQDWLVRQTLKDLAASARTATLEVVHLLQHWEALAGRGFVRGGCDYSALMLRGSLRLVGNRLSRRIGQIAVNETGGWTTHVKGSTASASATAGGRGHPRHARAAADVDDVLGVAVNTSPTSSPVKTPAVDVDFAGAVAHEVAGDAAAAAVVAPVAAGALTHFPADTPTSFLAYAAFHKLSERRLHPDDAVFPHPHARLAGRSAEHPGATEMPADASAARRSRVAAGGVGRSRAALRLIATVRTYWHFVYLHVISFKRLQRWGDRARGTVLLNHIAAAHRHRKFRERCREAAQLGRAAKVLQRVGRGWTSRVLFMKWRPFRAACRAAWCRFVGGFYACFERMVILKHTWAAKVLQRLYRERVLYPRQRREKLYFQFRMIMLQNRIRLKLHIVRRKRHRAACAIQRQWRRWAAWRARCVAAATRIQTAFRWTREAHAYAHLRFACQLMQRGARKVAAVLAARRRRRRRERAHAAEDSAAVAQEAGAAAGIIQRGYRRCMRTARLRGAVTAALRASRHARAAVVQGMCRARAAARFTAALRTRRWYAAALQRVGRGWLVGRAPAREALMARRVQRRWRAYLRMRAAGDAIARRRLDIAEAALILRRELACRAIQRVVRGHGTRRRDEMGVRRRERAAREAAEDINAKVVLLQALARRMLNKKKVEARWDVLRNAAARVIQRAHRARLRHLARVKLSKRLSAAAKETALQQRVAARKIQTCWRIFRDCSGITGVHRQAVRSYSPPRSPQRYSFRAIV